MSTKIANTLGDWNKNEEVLAYNRTGTTLAKGDIVVLDLTASDGATVAYATLASSSTPDSATSPFANVITATATHIGGWIYLVCLSDSVADDGIGKFGIRGVYQVKVATGNSIGARLSPGISTHLIAAQDGRAILGIALEGNASGSTALKWVRFNGDAVTGPYSEVS